MREKLNKGALFKSHFENDEEFFDRVLTFMIIITCRLHIRGNEVLYNTENSSDTGILISL